jgi:hypothetical protein
LQLFAPSSETNTSTTHFVPATQSESVKHSVANKQSFKPFTSFEKVNKAKAVEMIIFIQNERDAFHFSTWYLMRLLLVHFRY